MKATRYIPKEIEIEVTNITLLTIEEASALPLDIRCYEEYWWLRSPGCNSKYDADVSVAAVSDSGTISVRGFGVNYNFVAVRPALTLSNLDSEPLEIGENIRIAGTNYIVIGKDRVLYNDEPVFRRFDEKSNEYEKSEIKKIVDEWFDAFLF